MAEGTIKKLTDRGFGFIKTGGDKAFSSTHRASKASVSTNCVKAKRCPTRKAGDQKARAPRTSSRCSSATTILCCRPRGSEPGLARRPFRRRRPHRPGRFRPSPARRCGRIELGWSRYATKRENDGRQHLHPRPTPNTVRSADGKVLAAPEGWVLLPPGDAALTRRVKAAGDHWVVQEKKGRKVFSRGVWAPAATIDKIRAELEAERSTEGYAKRKDADARRRDKAQAEYVEDFYGAVLAFLAFHPAHADLAERLARAVADHATPVGSGTVARTKRIPVEQRAEAAVIAWMRHQTTAYESMVIPRIKGKRREVRRMLPSDPRSC